MSRPKPGSAKDREIMAALSQMLAFCTAHQLNPHRWLYATFLCSEFKRAPKLEALCSPEVLPAYNRVGQQPAPLLAQQNALRATSVVPHNKATDMTAGAEAFKRQLVERGEYERCIALMETMTYGFHPLSRECAKCPVTATCIEKLRAITRSAMLGGDIVALRAQPRKEQPEHALPR